MRLPISSPTPDEQTSRACGLQSRLRLTKARGAPGERLATARAFAAELCR